MKKAKKIIRDLLESFIMGGIIGFVLVILQSVRYTVKSGLNDFALAIGFGNIDLAERWRTITIEQAIFICIGVGVALMFIDLIYIIIKLLLNKKNNENH